MKNIRRLLVVTLPLTLVAASALFSQSVPRAVPGKYNLRGTVRDAVGGWIPGSIVVLRDFRSGQSRSAITDECGKYMFSDIQPSSTYEIVASWGSDVSPRLRISLIFLTETEKILDLKIPNAMGEWCLTGYEHCFEVRKGRAK